MKRSMALPLLLLLLAPLHLLGAEELRGRIELLAKGGKGPAKGSDVRQAIVYYEPAVSPSAASTAASAASATSATSAASRATEKTFEMVTRGKEFVPRVLAVPRGSRVLFPNADPILHNVFSVSAGNSFDLGLYKKGPGREKIFENAGVVRVYCNVHQAMAAYILVVDTPHFVNPAEDGSFVLTGLPKGAGKLTVWHEQTEPWTISVQLPAGPAPITARIEVTRPQVPSHLDKSGKSYFSSSRDGYRH
jgi:plastocyanin